MNHTNYIVVKRARFKTISGDVNFPYGTTLKANGNVIMSDNKPVCAVFSSCAHEYFAHDDDGNGLLRGSLVRAIKSTLAKTDSLHQARWDKVWDDPRCQRFKNNNREDYWLWNQDFYDAEIDDLKHIAELIGVKEVR